MLNQIYTDIVAEYNEAQCDKRNTYRRKIKEEKAAAAARDVLEGGKEGEDVTEGANGIVNGHVEGEDAERPVKKLKAEDGTAMAPDVDGTEDEEMDVDHEGDQDDVEEQQEDEDDEDGDDEDDDTDDQEIEVSGTTLDEADLDGIRVEPGMRDEALDDPDSDSD